jgi:histidine phosphotransferase ChpT
MPDLRLAALLCSRLCHDLIGPIGALNNGIEILADEDDPDMREQATQLLGDSADEAARRLRFYRFAFGASGGMGQTIPLSEARDAAQGLFHKGRTKLDWPADLAQTAVPKSLVKLLMNMILLAGAALPRGGTLVVEPGSAAHPHFVVVATGVGARIDGECRSVLEQKFDESLLDSQNVIAFFSVALAAEQGLRMAVADAAEGSVKFALVAA